MMKSGGDSKGTSPLGGKGIRWMAFQFPELAAALPQCCRANLTCSAKKATTHSGGCFFAVVIVRFEGARV